METKTHITKDMLIGDVLNNSRQGIAVLTLPTVKLVKKSKKLPVGAVSSLADLFAERANLLVYKVPQR